MRSAHAALLLALLSLPAAAQSGRTGTIVVAHGGDSAWNAGVVAAAREARTDGPVEVSFLMGSDAAKTRFQDAVRRLVSMQVREIVVVPMLVSSHSGHYDQVRWLAGEAIELDESMRHHLHMAGIERAMTTVPLRVTKAIDSSPELAQVLADRGLALAASLGAAPGSRALLLVGHGPNSAEDHAAWMEHLRPIAEQVKTRTGFRDVRVEVVRDDAPPAVRAEAVRRVRELVELQQLATGAEVLVVPILISKGAISRDKLPADLLGTASQYRNEPLLPHPAMVRWIESRVRSLPTP